MSDQRARWRETEKATAAWRAKTQATGDAVAEPEDRRVIEADLRPIT